MNIFFYPASVSKYTKLYFEALQSCITGKDLVLLPSGSGLASHPCLSLRSGDILILYAENDFGIESLLAMEDDCKDFRVLLLLNPECSRYHKDCAFKLNPIFVAEPGRLTELSTVVMNILSHNDDANWSSLHPPEVI